MTDDLIAEGRRLREEAAAEAFMALPLDQPWPAHAAWAKWLYDHGDALLSALKAAERPQPVPGDGIELDCYDAGLLGDYGGGNIEWWWDYLRAELGRAHNFYQSQVAALSRVSTPGREESASSVGSPPEGGTPSPSDGQVLRAGEVEHAAQFLWALLDDIDTASDMAKGDDAAYREFVERHQRRRFEVGSTDGYVVSFRRPASPGLALATLAPEEHHEALGRLIQQAWRDLCEKSDRTSPAEYPERCLIECSELADTMVDAWGLGRESVRHEGLALMAAARTMADDHQVSERHHPDHVLVPLAAFNALRAALQRGVAAGPSDGEAAERPNPDQAERDALKAERDEAVEAFSWLAANRNCELSYGYDHEDEDGAWRVHRVNGGINDREWTLIGSGPAPLASLVAARHTLTGGEKP